MVVWQVWDITQTWDHWQTTLKIGIILFLSFFRLKRYWKLNLIYDLSFESNISKAIYSCFNFYFHLYRILNLLVNLKNILYNADQISSTKIISKRRKIKYFQSSFNVGQRYFTLKVSRVVNIKTFSYLVLFWWNT